MSSNNVAVQELGPDIACVTPLERRSRYPSRPPALSNMQDVAQDWRRKTENVLFRTEAVLNDAFLVDIRDATVLENGFVFTRDGKAITESLRGADQTVDLPAAPADAVADFSVLLRKPGDSNFGHWLIELCPRIIEFQKAFPDGTWRVAVPGHPLALRDLRRETLGWLGIPEERIIWLSGTPTTFARLAFISSNSIHSHTHDADGVLAVRAHALRAIPRAPGRRRLYVARPETARRLLLNEADITAALRADGFEIVRPEHLSIREQVELFSNAEAIAGISGAALTNILFAPEDCKILSLMPNYGFEFFFWDIANIIGQDFSYIVGEAEAPDQLGHSNFKVDLKYIEEWQGRLKS